jgi:hypothetical protein
MRVDQLSRGKHLALQLKRWLAQPTPFDTTTDPRSIAQRQLQCTLRPRAQWIRDQLVLFRRYLVSVRGGELELQPSTKR